MYSVHAYYSAVVCQSLSLVWFYPIIVTLGSFYCYSFEYSDPSDLMNYMGALILICLSGSLFGLSVGTITSDENVAILLGNLIVILFNFGAGCLSNTGDNANPVIKFLSWVSPMHYGVEIVFKQVSKGRVG